VGRQHSGRPDLSPPSVFTYKYRGGEHKKRGQGKEEKEERGEKERKKKQREVERKKNEKKNREKVRRKKQRRSCHQHRPRLEPPPSLAITDDWGWVSLLQLKTLPLFLLLSFLPLPCRTCMVHASVGEVKMVTVLIHSNHLMWLGSWILGWVRSNPTMVGRVRPSKKNICLKFYDFQAFCFKLFCLISVCILCHKTTKNPILKHLVFVNLKKKFEERKKCFCVTAKCLKAKKKSYCVFIHQKTMF